jgi:hypothetical protein
VVELGAVDPGLGLQALEIGAALVQENGSRPAGDGRSIGRELVQGEPPEDPEVVVADEADPRPLANDLDHLVGPRPVADQVAEAPELLRRVGVDRLEDGLEPV